MIWRTIIFGAVLAALALINDQLLWLPPLQFAALAISVLLIVVAPRPAWVALVIAGLTAYSVRSVFFMVDFGHMDAVCLNGSAICSATQPGWYTSEEKIYSPGVTRFFLELPVVPAWLVVVGVLGWAIRRRSWRTAIAGAVYGLAVVLMPFQAPIVLFAAAAAAVGPRKDFRYLAGIGIVAIALMDPHMPWSLVGTFATVLAAIGLGIWALANKDGVNGVVAVVALASASLTPFLGAGVLIAASFITRRAWIGLAVATAAVGLAVFSQWPTSSDTGFTTLRGVEMSAGFAEPDQPSWMIAPGLLLAAAAVAALFQYRHRNNNDQANG